MISFWADVAISAMRRASFLARVFERDVYYQMRFDRIKAEYFHRVEELRARFEEETLCGGRPVGPS